LSFDENLLDTSRYKSGISRAFRSGTFLYAETVMHVSHRLAVMVALLLLILICSLPVLSQSEAAAISGRVADPQGLAVVAAKVSAVNISTNVASSTQTNGAGFYNLPSLLPGTYRIIVEKEGFAQIVKPDVQLHVQDNAGINFSLQVGSVTQSVTVEGGAPLVNTESAAVSTVIDRNFVENLPLNGRSFNTLLQLTPGVVVAQTTGVNGAPGQFSVSGQRTDANNFTVDGVSANFGVGAFQNPAESGTGGAPAFSVLGSTSSLVSVDALQEFRIETSSFSPEFGRTPGAQVILTTRSGTNEFHGGLFDYFRNTVMDANDWFANQAGNPRAPEHHNDFGGFIGGPIWKNRTFFFVSYEGARLRLPQTAVIQVPSEDARTNAPVPIAPYLNAYPKPNGPVSADGTTAQFTGTLSNAATLDATSVRIDHVLSERFSIFGRYNYAPSDAQLAFGPSSNLSNPMFQHVGTQTATLGANMMLSPSLSNTLRGNYSSQTNRGTAALNSFGGAVPLDPQMLLGSLASANNLGFFQPFDVVSYEVGNLGSNESRQLNFTDTLEVTSGLHQLKLGGDYRAIFLHETQAPTQAFYFANNVQSLLDSGSAILSSSIAVPARFLVQSLSLFGQDTWRPTSRLTITYGLRWELNPAPSARGKTTLAAFQNVNDPSEINLVPSGRPLWATTHGNFAPRVGIAWRLTRKGDFVLRAGAGVFYDLGLGQAANLAYNYPNAAFGFVPSVSLPVSDLTPFLPTISLQPPFSSPVGFDPSLKLPRSYQWNVAFEKSFAGQQAFTVTYVGQAGRDLLRQSTLFQPNANFTGDVFLTRNDARSNYSALQLQFRRRLASGIQGLLSYSWSHSLDNASNDVAVALPSTISSGANDYASSGFDVRHSFSGALSYDVPAAASTGLFGRLTRNWSIQSVVAARTGFPFNGVILFGGPDPGGARFTRPDRVPGQPLWISDPTAAGGRSLNSNAFSIPPSTRQGTEGRNDITGFGFVQVDLSVGRRFLITDRVSLLFRADGFNVLNHPNFTSPSGFVQFGTSGLKAFEMLNQGLQGLNPLFQQGGPRSLQLSLKLTF
jgi:hypothetical protein